MQRRPKVAIFAQITLIRLIILVFCSTMESGWIYQLLRTGHALFNPTNTRAQECETAVAERPIPTTSFAEAEQMETPTFLGLTRIEQFIEESEVSESAVAERQTSPPSIHEDEQMGTHTHFSELLKVSREQTPQSRKKLQSLKKLQ